MMSKYDGVMTVIFNSNGIEMEELCKQMRNRGGSVWISCYNSSQQVCIGGRERDVERVELKALRMGASYHRIKVTIRK